MLSVISYKTISSSPDLFFSLHRLRYQEFVDRQHYAVKTIDGMEYDEFDNAFAATHLVYSEDGKHVLGCSRLFPVEGRCMLSEHFFTLVDDPLIYTLPRTWEGTRFCIDSALPPDKRLQILRHIAVGYLEYALSEGIDRIIGLMPTLILRSVFERNGITLRRLGVPHQIGEHSKIQAACIDVSIEQYARACEKTGIYSPLGMLRPPREGRNLA
ncbi:acyl-homoserine-lactone synthase [Asticcacaulis sp.]|uniref:acyl-homoserine-lactone synthase n=1 Tax=Asticcacaulis sp. TaxID=1872648 RepID=UPI002C3D9403|nr:acyl-homoserine-lactone synthase [Asticcacaulis sp.]HTM82232.1 acyl-homoserine-lactone synthase [Asticcacaulis sp.]